MRYLSILILLIIQQVDLFGQDFVIKSTNQNDIWLGMRNPIYVIVDNTPCDSIFLAMKGGVIENSKYDFVDYQCQKGAYYINPTEKNDCEVIVYKINKSDTILIGSQKYRVRDFPGLTCKVAGEPGGEISNKVLSAQIGIASELDNTNFPFYISIKYTVTKYSVVITSNNKCLLVQDFEGNRFTDELKTTFRNLESGDIVIFHGIEAIGPDGITRKPNSIEFLIK